MVAASGLRRSLELIDWPLMLKQLTTYSIIIYSQPTKLNPYELTGSASL